jgi:hypothetical protein
MNGELRFDVFTTKDGHIARMFTDLSLDAARIMAGERDKFDMAIIDRGWSGTSPAWTGFKPVVIVPHGQLIQHDQFTYLIELAG